MCNLEINETQVKRSNDPMYVCTLYLYRYTEKNQLSYIRREKVFEHFFILGYKYALFASFISKKNISLNEKHKWNVAFGQFYS